MEPGQIEISRPGGTPLLLHHGTPYRVNKFEPFERGVRADQGGAVSWGDGDWSGAEWRAGATLPMRLGIHTGSWDELMAAWWALDAALAPVRTGPEVEVRWNAAGAEYLMYARPRGTSLRNTNGRTGKAWVDIELECPDPAIYSAEEHSVEMGMLRRIGGTPIPHILPVALYAVVADGEATITNTGTSPARLLLRIDGPATRPYITLATATGTQVLNLDTVLGEGDWLDIDTVTKEVVLNGSVSRLRDAYGDWPTLTGTGLVRFQAETYNDAARLTVRWRDTY